MNKKIKITITIMLTLIILGGVVCYITQKGGKSNPNSQTQDKKDEEKEVEDQESQPESFADLDFPVDKNNKKKNAEKAVAKNFVGNIKNSGIVAHGIQPFNGVFIETMQDTACSNVATILLENTTDRMIAYLLLTLDAEGTTWTFEATAIPAGAHVIIQEKGAKAYIKGNVSCKDLQLAKEENTGKLEGEVFVETGENGSLTVKNISQEDIPILRLFYKLKLNGENVYVGGITYTVKLEDLKAGDSQTVYPSHFVKKYAEIMMIRKYEE